MTFPALRLDRVSKRYPGVQALADVSFECLPGEVHAIVGENGSGKSTLIGIASGAIVPDSGRVEILGRHLEEARPALARRMGLFAVYQDSSLVPELSVAQNLHLSVPPDKRPRYADLVPWAEEQLGRYGLEVDPRATVADLSYAQRQMLEVVKALICIPEVLLLDEPTTALDFGQVEHLHRLIRGEKTRGAAVVYVSHRLGEILDVADRITVLRDGRIQGTFPARGITPERVVSLMVGTPVEMTFPAKHQNDAPAEVVLSVEELMGPRFGPVGFRLHRGEILGLAGAEGNGQREILRALAGLEPAEGRVTVRGRRLRLNSPGASLEAGLMILSGDRLREAIFPPLGVRHNMTVQSVKRFALGPIVNGRRESANCHRLTEQLRIATPSLEQPIIFLSGGNQQKAVLARAFLGQAEVLLVDEPTQGVDARSRLDIYRALRDRSAEGVSIIVNSSDALELAGLCDRVLVVSRGQVIRELRGEELSEERIVASFVAAAPIERRSIVERARAQAHGLTGILRRLPLLPSLLSKEWAPLALLVALMRAVGGCPTGQPDAFLTAIHMRHLLTNTFPLALVAMAQLNVLLVGHFDISVGNLMTLTVVLASFLLLEDKSPLALVGGALALLCVGSLVGLGNGALVKAVRIPSVIATIATASVLQGIALLLRPTPAGVIDFAFADSLLRPLGFLPWAFIVVAFLAVLGDLWLHFTSGGLRTRAVGLREEAARRVGVNTGRIYWRAFVLSGLLAALAGLFLAAQTGVGSPTIGAAYTLNSLAAAVLGGASLTGGHGSFIGALLGALFLSLVINIIPFLHINTAFGLIATGGLALVAISLYSLSRLFLPAQR